MAQFSLSSPPGALGRGQKVKYHLISIIKSILSIFKPNFVCLFTNERYKKYHTAVSISGVGGSKIFFFRNSAKFGVRVIFFGPRPLGPLGGAKRSNII